MQHMVAIVSHLSGNFGIRRLRVSVPLVPALLDGVRYFREGDLPPLAGNDLQVVYRPRIQAKAPRPPRRTSYTRQQISAFYRVLAE